MCISYDGDCLIIIIAVSVPAAVPAAGPAAVCTVIIITFIALLSLCYNLLRFADQYLPRLCLGRG
jgi:hypothetical protein